MAAAFYNGDPRRRQLRDMVRWMEDAHNEESDGRWDAGQWELSDQQSRTANKEDSQAETSDRKCQTPKRPDTFSNEKQKEGVKQSQEVLVKQQMKALRSASERKAFKKNQRLPMLK